MFRYVVLHKMFIPQLKNKQLTNYEYFMAN